MLISNCCCFTPNENHAFLSLFVFTFALSWAVEATSPHRAKELSQRKDTAMNALCKAYNKGKLGRGTRVAPVQKHGYKLRWNGWVHRNAWTLSGTIELAFGCIGQVCPNAPGLHVTRRPLDAISAVSLAAQIHIEDAASTLVSAVKCQGIPTDWLFFSRHMDATPERLAFGKLAKFLAPVARFWQRDRKRSKGDQWKLVTLAELTLKSPKLLPKYGIVEILAQSGSVSWRVPAPGQVGRIERRDFSLQACFLQRGNSSCLFRAYSVINKSLSFPRMIECADYVKIVDVFLGSDLAGCQNRIAYYLIAYRP